MFLFFFFRRQRAGPFYVSRRFSTIAGVSLRARSTLVRPQLACVYRSGDVRLGSDQFASATRRNRRCVPRQSQCGQTERMRSLKLFLAIAGVAFFRSLVRSRIASRSSEPHRQKWMPRSLGSRVSPPSLPPFFHTSASSHLTRKPSPVETAKRAREANRREHHRWG